MRAQHSFLHIEFCVIDEQGTQQLKTIMQSIAKSENLKYVDNSENVRGHARLMDENFPYKEEEAYAIDLYLKGYDALGVIVGNSGLRRYNFSLGVTEGSDPVKAHRIADKIVKSLPQHWRVKKVPEGKGAFPMKSCGG